MIEYPLACNCSTKFGTCPIPTTTSIGFSFDSLIMRLSIEFAIVSFLLKTIEYSKGVGANTSNHAFVLVKSEFLDIYKRVIIRYFLVMERVPIKTLKARMAHFFERVARGEIFEITKHNKPYVYVAGSSSPHLHLGQLSGKTSLEVGKKIKLKKSILSYLQEDRNEDD